MWYNVKVEHFQPIYNNFNKAQVGTCHFCKQKGIYADGDYLVIRTSEMTDSTYTDYACLTHAKDWKCENNPAAKRWREIQEAQLGALIN